jgi:hypothetical protein
MIKMTNWKKSSDETAHRHEVWRPGGNAIKVQMVSLVPDLSKKLIKAERVKKWSLCIWH